MIQLQLLVWNLPLMVRRGGSLYPTVGGPQLGQAVLHRAGPSGVNPFAETQRFTTLLAGTLRIRSLSSHAAPRRLAKQYNVICSIGARRRFLRYQDFIVASSR